MTDENHKPLPTLSADDKPHDKPTPNEKSTTPQMPGIFSRPGSRLQPGTAARAQQSQAHARQAGSPATTQTTPYADHDIAARAAARRDAMAESAGFISREAPVVLSRRRGIVSHEPKVNLNIRLPVSVNNRFVAFVTNTNAQSYWDGIEQLLNLAGIGPSGELPDGRNE